MGTRHHHYQPPPPPPRTHTPAHQPDPTCTCTADTRTARRATMPFSCKPSRTAAAQALVAAIVLLLAPSASAVRKCGQKDLNLAAGADSIPSDCTSLSLG